MSTWIAPDAVVFGDVRFGEDCSVYYHCVVRTEEGKIVFGEKTNLQDNCIVHNEKEYPVIIGDRVTVGHGCILHGCQVGDDSLIGMGSILLNGAKIGKNCLIGAGSLVSGNTVIPDGSVAYAGCRNNGDITPDAPRARVHAAVSVTDDAGKTWSQLAYVNPIGGYCDIAAHGDALYVLYEMTENGVISRMLLRKYILTNA